MLSIFRVKCVQIPKKDGMSDSHLTKGMFYDVMDVHQSMDGIEYFWVKGGLGETVWRSSHCFSRPMKRRRYVVATGAMF